MLLSLHRKRKTTTMSNTIQTGDTLTVSFIGDSELKPQIKVIERKGNFAKVELSRGEVARKKVFTYNNEEFIYPYGRHSMAAIASKHY